MQKQNINDKKNRAWREIKRTWDVVNLRHGSMVCEEKSLIIMVLNCRTRREFIGKVIMKGYLGDECQIVHRSHTWR
jgi:hypothetical protein